MLLKDYISRFGVDALADGVQTNAVYLRHIATGRRRPSGKLAIRIERATSGTVTCEDLRPDMDWAYIRGTKSRVVATPHSAALEKIDRFITSEAGDQPIPSDSKPE